MTSPQTLSISARLLKEAAEKRGITCTPLSEHLIFMEKGDRNWYTSGSRTSLQSSVGKTIADLKDVTKKVLQFHNLPTTPHRVISKPEELEQLKQLTFPLVMKPLDGNQGEGVVVGIADMDEAKVAYQEFGQEQKKPALFEEMLEGTEYRILCIEYQFCAAVQRKPAYVTGDGTSSIQQLIDQKNSHPWRGEGHNTPLSLIKVDSIVTSILHEQGYTVENIPNQSVEVVLRRTSNLSTGGEPWNVTTQVCEENKKLFEKIAQVCDLNTTGIDVMCHDLSMPFSQQEKAGIVEVNVSPGLRMHHFPLKGEPFDAAGRIIDMVLKNYHVS